MCQTPAMPPAQVPARPHDLLLARQTRGFRFTESLHREFIPPHTHEHATVTVLLDGMFEETYGLSRMACEAKSVLLRPAGEQHADHVGRSGAHNFVFELTDAQLQRIQAYAPLFDEVAHLRDPRLIALVQRMRAEVHAKDEAADLVLEGLALEFLAHAIRTRESSRQARRVPVWLRRAEEMMRDCFAQEGLQMRDIAATVGVHPVYFARLFKAHYGCTPGAYVRRLRVEWAALQLKAGTCSIAEIALGAGFADQSHFGRVFKRQMGYSPGVWRAMQSGT